MSGDPSATTSVLTVAEWLTIIALVAGPVLAIQVSELLQRRRERRNRRVELFRNLMATRRARLSGMHVHNLNLIDIEFHGERKVLEAWKAYLDHLSTPSDAFDLWNDKADTFLTELLFAMSNALKFGFERTHIKRAAYSPQAFGDTDVEFLAIRKALVSILAGKTSVPVELVPPSEPTAAATKAELGNAVARVMSGRSAVRVKIVDDDAGADGA